MLHRRGRFVSGESRAGRGRRLLLGGLLAVLALAVPAGAAQAALPALNVTIGKSAVTVSGSEVSGATNVVSTAEKGLKEPDTLLFQLKAGVTVEEFKTFLASSRAHDPNSLVAVGSIVFDAEDHPGGTSEAQTLLQPATYVALNAEGDPAKSPMASFTVTAAPTPLALPAPGAVVKTIEFGFKGPKTLKDGEVVRFENEGFLVHMDVAFPVKSKKSGEKLVKVLRSGGAEKAAQKLIAGPPVTFYGPISSGGFQQETITAKPGYYVQACFMETQDGREHIRLGMERLFKITK